VSGEVTVVIPTRDRPALLADALASVAAQERPAARVLVVDDGSAVPPRVPSGVELQRRPASAGVSAARNHALAQVETEWVAFLDDDDLWAPSKLARQVAVGAAGADVVWCSVVVVDAWRRPVGVVEAADPRTLPERLRRTNAIGSPSAVLARTALVRAAGGFDEELALLADWDLWLRLAATGRGAACPERLAAYTEHQGNMSAAERGRLDAELARMTRVHGRLGGAELARWSVGGHRRGGGRLTAAGAYLAAGVRERDAGSLARAPAALLGEDLVGRLRRRRAASRVGDPAWLACYRRDAATPLNAPSP
jgi:hypothetical protein